MLGPKKLEPPLAACRLLSPDEEQPTMKVRRRRARILPPSAAESSMQPAEASLRAPSAAASLLCMCLCGGTVPPDSRAVVWWTNMLPLAHFGRWFPFISMSSHSLSLSQPPLSRALVLSFGNQLQMGHQLIKTRRPKNSLKQC
jgi:hypothetical protein